MSIPDWVGTLLLIWVSFVWVLVTLVGLVTVASWVWGLL
jgi:hypothetical protein